jgi:PTS system galactitol-specific IIB component
MADKVTCPGRQGAARIEGSPSMSDKKKRILITCGSGIVTSTIARKKIEELLDTHGYKGRYEIVQVPLSTASKKSKDCDFIVATAIKPSELHCPFVDGTPYLMGRHEDEANKQILHLMGK